MVVVNNSMGKAIMNLRWSLRQGDVPSMFWFAFAIDPLIAFLDNKLKGILIYSLLLHGPAPEGLQSPLPDLEQRYREVGYADDLKPAITNIQEFSIVDHASELFKKRSGCQLHRDPESGKFQFLG